jgi:hypothetical protein
LFIKLLVNQFCVWPFYRCLGLQEGREGEREGERYEGKWLFHPDESGQFTWD